MTTNHILGIDPGPEHSAWVEYHPETHTVFDVGFDENTDLRDWLQNKAWQYDDTTLVVETITSYGMPVGESTFETMFWIGRFVEAWCGDWKRIKRPDIKLRLCGTMSAKDPNVRQALLDRFSATGGGKVPQIGTKSSPGPLYGVGGHIWSALAVAVAWDEYQNDGRRRYDPTGMDAVRPSSPD